MKIKNLKVYFGASLILSTMTFSSCKKVSEDISYRVIPKPTTTVSIENNIQTTNEIEEIIEEKIEEIELQNYFKDINNSITISFTGDCTLGTYAKSQYKYFDILFNNQQDYDYYFKNVKEIFDNDDYTVVNLEGPLTDAVNYQSDKPFAFKGPKEYVNILSHGGVEAVNLSNNHINDYYEEGYNDTLDTLNESSIAYFNNSNFHIADIKGHKVGFAGFKAFNLGTKTEIEKAIQYFNENNVDTKIIILHGGIEYDYQFDSIKQELGRYAIDNGADLIVGHHPHIM